MQRLIDKGFKVRVSIQFRGREISHPDLGMDRLHDVYESLGEGKHLAANPTLKNREAFMIVEKR